MTREQLNRLSWVDLASSQVSRAAWLDVGSSEEAGLNEGLEWKDVDTMALSRAPSHMLVEFKGGKSGPTVYAYRGVSVDDFIAFVKTDSPGRALNASIKGAFPYCKLEVTDG